MDSLSPRPTLGRSKTVGRWHLSRYIGFGKPHGGPPLVRSLLTESAWPLDGFARNVLQALASGPKTVAELRAAVSGEQEEGPQKLDELLARFAEMRVILPNPDDSLEPVWRSVSAQVPELPHVDFVEINNVCQAQCVMCNVGNGQHKRARGFMDLPLFERILSFIPAHPDAKPLTLHNSGEPLLHPQLTRFVETAKRQGIGTEISTNPGLLDLDRYRALRDAGLARLIIALDATDAETLRKIRGINVRPERAHANLDALLEERARTGEKAPGLVIQFVEMSWNTHQREAFAARYGNLGLPGVEVFIKPVEAPVGSPLFKPGVRPQQFFCRAPWSIVGVLWDGRVVPCCYDANATMVLGDLRHQTLQEVWQGDAVRALRERIRQDACAATELCATCPNRADRYQLPTMDEMVERPADWLR